MLAAILRAKWMWAAVACGAASLFGIHAGVDFAFEVMLQAVLAVSVVVVIAEGAEWLVDASCRVAQALGVSHLVIGLTVVAFGTSAPEIAASLVAGFQGNGDITIANVVGSNIFNICFILGGVAVLVHGGLQTTRPLVERDGPVLLGAGVLLFLFVGANPFAAAPPVSESAAFWPRLLNLQLERAEGIILLSSLVAYVVYLYRASGFVDAEEAEKEQRMTEETFGVMTWKDGPLLLLGVAAVVFGCQLLVGQAEVVEDRVIGYGALWFARVWEVPDWVIGVTIIAAGTSAPELVVSMMAAARGAFGLSAGNLVGSDIFNALGVVGLAGILIQPPAADAVTVSAAVVPGLASMGATVLLLVIFMRSGSRVTRAEGVILVLVGIARWALDFSAH